MILGWWRMGTSVHQGGIFLAFGSTVISMTVSAGRVFYGYFGDVPSLVIMFLSVAFVALASIKWNSRALSIGSLILSGLAPLFSGVYGDEVQLFSYLMVVVLGTIWVVAKTGQRVLNTASLVMIILFSLPWLLSYGSNREIVLMFIYAFSVIFFITNTLAILKNKGNIEADLVTAGGSGLFLLTWIIMVVDKDWQSLIISAWMIVFAAGAFVIFKITKRIEPFYIYAGVGVAMLAAATAAELNGAALVIAYTFEVAVIALLMQWILQNTVFAEKTSLLIVVPIILSFENIVARDWRDSVIHEHFFVLLFLGITMLSLGLYFWQFRKASNTSKSLEICSGLVIAGSLYLYLLLWLSLHASFQNDDQAVMFALFIYTVIGLITYIYGRVHNIKGFSVYGGVLLGFVVGRLLLVDVWKMELSGRIITFFIIGSLLIGTAFIGRSKKGEVNNVQ